MIHSPHTEFAKLCQFKQVFPQIHTCITTFFKAVCDPGEIKSVFLSTFVFTGWWKYIALTKIFYDMCLESAKGKLSSPTSKNKFYSIFYSSYFFINKTYSKNAGGFDGARSDGGRGRFHPPIEINVPIHIIMCDAWYNLIFSWHVWWKCFYQDQNSSVWSRAPRTTSCWCTARKTSFYVSFYVYDVWYIWKPYFFMRIQWKCFFIML